MEGRLSPAALPSTSEQVEETSTAQGQDGMGLTGDPVHLAVGTGATGMSALQLGSCCRLSVCMQEGCGPVTRKTMRWHLKSSDLAVPRAGHQ